MTIRVLVVDDHPLFASAVSGLIGLESDMVLVGVAGSVADARMVIASGRRIDVAILDYTLGDGTGVTVARDLLARHPRAHVIMLTAVDDIDAIVASVHAGADGYLSKKDAVEVTLADAVRRVDAGEVLLPPGIVARIADRVRVRGDSPEPASIVDPLTDREIEVLRLLAEGRTAGEIGMALGMKWNTARSHIQHIISKTNAHSRLEAVAIGLRLRLIDPPS